MSVVEGKRSEGELLVVVKANSIVDYTLQICTNEKQFPKRYRWCVTSRIVNVTCDVNDLIIRANAVYVRLDDDSAERRLSYQAQALELTYVVLNLIDIAYRRFNLDPQKVKHWAGMVKGLQELIRRWRKNDAERYKKLKTKRVIAEGDPNTGNGNNVRNVNPSTGQINNNNANNANGAPQDCGKVSMQ